MYLLGRLQMSRLFSLVWNQSDPVFIEVSLIGLHYLVCLAIHLVLDIETERSVRVQLQSLL